MKYTKHLNTQRYAISICAKRQLVAISELITETCCKIAISPFSKSDHVALWVKSLQLMEDKQGGCFCTQCG